MRCPTRCAVAWPASTKAPDAARPWPDVVIVRGWLSRHAISLWLLGIATLGLVRWWMKVGREGASMQAPDVMLWLACSLVLGAIGLVAYWRGR